MADMDFYELLSLIQKNHPDIFAILSQPGVADIAFQAIKAESAGQPWTNERLQAALQATPWFQNTRPDVRAFQVLRATDPAAAGQRVELVKRQVDDLEAQLGVTLDTTGGLGSVGFSFLNDAVVNNWDQNEIKYRLLASVNSQRGAGLGSGEVGKTASDIRNMADQYAVPLSDQWIIAKASKVAAGADTMDSVQGYMQEQARSLFPGLKAALDEGQTVRQYAEPYVQLAQQELDINPNDVRFTDPKWMAALNQVDPKTGQRTAMALDSWLQKLRTDPTYGYDTTAKGRQDATTLATQLSQKFGASA